MPGKTSKPTRRRAGRICRFCGLPANSREHLWPDWLNDVLPNYTQTVFLQGNGDQQKVVGRGRPASHRLKVVCDACNTRWMSQLESAAKPILIPLINGRKQPLHGPAQRTIAAWAFKTAVIAEQLSPTTAVIPVEQRQWLKEHGTPPPEAHVFVSATDARAPGDSRYAQSLLSLDYPEPTEATNGFVATLRIRHLAVQVVGTTFTMPEHDVSIGFNFAPPLAASVQRIWPFERNFTWPPGFILDPDGVTALERHWSGSGGA